MKKFVILFFLLTGAIAFGSDLPREIIQDKLSTLNIKPEHKIKITNFLNSEYDERSKCLKVCQTECTFEEMFKDVDSKKKCTKSCTKVCYEDDLNPQS